MTIRATAAAMSMGVSGCFSGLRQHTKRFALRLLLAFVAALAPAYVAHAAYLFNASGEYIEGALGSQIGLPLTIGCWVKQTDLAATITTFINVGTDNFWQRTSVLVGDLAGSGDRLDAGSYNVTDVLANATETVSAGSLDGVWYLALGKYSTTTSRTVYFPDSGNKTENTTSNDPTAALDNVSLGNNLVSGTADANGLVSDCFIYDAALSDANIDLLAGGMSPECVDAGNLFEYWALDTDNSTQTGLNMTALAVTNATFDADSPGLTCEPEFDVAPSVTSQTATAYTITYDGGTLADNIYCGAWAKDATAPTGAQIEAGTGALSAVATEAVTGASDTIVVTPTADPPYPIHDLYCVLEEGTANYSVVADGDMLDELLDVPSGFQRDTVAGTLAGFLVGSSAAAGDIMQSNDSTDPDAFALTVNADGSWEYAAGGSTAKQTWTAAVYDVSAAGWLDSPAYRTICAWNAAPEIGIGLIEPIELSYLVDVEIASVTLTDYSTDDDGDARDITNSGNYPSGITETANVASGTPDMVGVARNTVIHTDECGSEDALSIAHTWLTRPLRPLFIGALASFSYAVGAEIAPYDFTADFDHDDSMVDPAMDLTYSLLQLGSSAVESAANGDAVGKYVIAVDDGSGFAAGDYIFSESDTDPHLVLAVYTNDIELATPITVADNDDVSLYTVGAGSVTGLALSMGGELTGTPTVTGTTSNLFVRAEDGSGEIKDTGLFSLAVVAGAGGRLRLGLGLGL